MYRFFLGLQRVSLCLALVGILSPATPGDAQELRSIQGRVVDLETGEGIPDVLVRAAGTQLEATTGASGAFLLEGLPAGERLLVFSHLGYGEHQQVVPVGNEGAGFEVRLSVEAIEIAPLVVETTTRDARERRARGSSSNIVDYERIQRSLGTSRHLGDLLRQVVPGIKMRQSNDPSSTGVCLEFRAAQSMSMMGRPCEHPKVYLDGVPVSSPDQLYGMLSLHTIEQLEVIPPGEAGARFGTGSLYGVILITTQRPGVRGPDNEVVPTYVSPSSRHFDWTQDPVGHNTQRVFLGAFLGNAIGIGAGTALAARCIGVDAKDELFTSCSNFETAGVALTALVLPAIGSALATRWAGGTERSVGRLGPATFGAAIGLVPGYAFALATEGTESEVVNAVGYAFLFAAVPVLVTGADRLFRKLRGS